MISMESLFIVWCGADMFSCWINIKSTCLTLQSNIVPGMSTHSSSNTPSAVMMLFFALSLMSKVFCKGTNKKKKNILTHEDS